MPGRPLQCDQSSSQGLDYDNSSTLLCIGAAIWRHAAVPLENVHGFEKSQGFSDCAFDGGHIMQGIHRWGRTSQGDWRAAGTRRRSSQTYGLTPKLCGRSSVQTSPYHPATRLPLDWWIRIRGSASASRALSKSEMTRPLRTPHQLSRWISVDPFPI